jgi:cellulose synthase/poly-beta-1,6-N-acetylglucosamine synthase-like glycosyltransferase
MSFSKKLTQIVSYFPFRYYLACIFFALVLLNSLSLIKSIEGDLISTALNYLNIPSFSLSGKLFVGDVCMPPCDVIVTKTVLIRFPSEIEVAFLTFFLAIATTARTSFAKRLRILSFGGGCFLVFILLKILLIPFFYGFGIIESVWSLRATTFILTVLVGGLIIHLTLFSTVLIPQRTKIKPTIKRKYIGQYLYLAAVLTMTGLILFSFEAFLNPDMHSPFTPFVHFYLWFRLPSIISNSYWMANLTRQLISKYLTKANRNKSGTPIVTKPLTLSFLIPAYNEEKLVGRCIESIDRAAANYAGKVEVILVNDGSTDRTEKVVSQAFQNLKHADGKLFTIPNSGKGFALAYGLEKTSGEVVFRTDADSIIDENAISPMMKHFDDPKVGSVCGWVFPLPELKGIWANAQRVMFAKAAYTKMAQAEFDSLLVMPGPTAAFRREALIQAGGWTDNIFGEDGEITNRVARYGYRGVYDTKPIVYSEVPETLKGLLQQRARWGVAFYHSRGRNWRLARELHTPRSLFFVWDLMAHGANFGRNLIMPLMIALLITSAFDLSSPIRSTYALASESVMIPLLLISKLVAIHVFLTTLQLVLLAYRLRSVNQVSALKYYPVMRLAHMIISFGVRPLVINVLLSWSTRWKEYSTESFKDLRKTVNISIDPLYPSGIPENKPKIAAISILSKEDLRKTVNISIDPLYPSGIPENKPKMAAISILSKA